jgi:murein DD-endopeptidase MepM/ murein hydrolase activator NlpD
MLQEAGRLRQYVVLHGHLDRPGPGIVAGAKVAPGDTLGFVGDSGSPGIVHLHLEVRQVREGVNLAAIEIGRLADNATSVPCDPRNVLPLAP